MEWTVVTVLIAVVGLALTVGTPIVRLNQTITTLNVTLEQIKRDVERNAKAISDQETASKESHRRIWDHNDKQDEQINNHEQRITRLESKGE